ncbi:MAG: alpha/beta hydrolase [Aestuariivirga sp.]
MRKFIIWTLAVAIVIATAVYGAFQFSPWPSALLIRRVFDRDAITANKALAKHAPPGISEIPNRSYDQGSADARLDVYFPADTGANPTIIWIHGGAWLSGSKDFLSNYFRILAGHGYTVVGVDYSLAPGAHYPTPIRQVNAALAHLKTNAAELKIDPANIFLAGDSAGSQIAGQMSNLITSPGYATQMQITPAIAKDELRGVILHCGAFGADGLNLDGPFGGFIRTTLWSYFGTSDFLNDPRLKEFSVTGNLTPAFPPFFISGGNADPLLPQSEQLAEAARGMGITVDTLFFPNDYAPPLAHEYQFNLDTDAGKLALERSLAFVASHVRK